jgi:hypothetical protein
MLPAAAFAQQTVTSGPWSITLGPAGPSTISYDGQVLLRNGMVGGYTPNWTASRFNLSGSQVTPTPTGATWARSVADNQDAALTLTTAANKLTLALDTTMRTPGPTEYSVEIAPEAVRSSETSCFVELEGKPSTLDLVGHFANFSIYKEIRFEQAERTIIVRCQGAYLQDRRALGQGFFLVYVLMPDKLPATAKPSIEVEVQPAAPADIPARRAFLSQTAAEQTDLPVANSGFEEGLKSWSDNPRAAVDTEVHHSGAQSASITIPTTQTDGTGVYLVQNIPVTGGLLYSAEAWIRTRDVVGASLADYFPTGGTVILEWADKKGGWLAPGDYATGSYGTTDWRLIQTRLIRAPKDAGFAIIFLTLRAHGTAWFDDVKLTQVHRNVILVSPAAASSIADNTPEFSWHYPDAAAATLELSPDAAFPAEKTVSYDGLQHSPFSPDKPLAPGAWFWRVTVPDHHASSPVWQFTQTAPLTQDCTPPVIAEDNAYLAHPRQPAIVHYSDNVGVTKVALTLDGHEVLAKVGPTSAVYTPRSDWTPGLHRLDVVASDAAGNKTSRRLFLNYEPGVVRKQWLVNGGIAIGGKPHFLLGMYGVLPSDIPTMAAAGYDFVHNYTWDGPGTNDTALAYLDECGKYGLQAFIGFDRKKLQAEDVEFVAERVGALSRHPALLAWYLFDEPDGADQYVSPDQLRRLYRLIKSLDPMHPVIVTVAGMENMPSYHDSYDVYWSMDYSNPASNVRAFEQHRRALRPDVPLMSIVHCYDGNQQGAGTGLTFDVDKFQPGPAMLRANAFMAIAHNSSGLCWWWWGQGSNIYRTVAHAPKAWDALKETLRQIRALRPVLEAQVLPRTWIEKPSDGVEVHLWEKRLPDRTVVIGVNRDNKTCDLTFASPSFTGKEKATVLFEDRTVALNAGRLTDSFAPLAVHIYEVR